MNLKPCQINFEFLLQIISNNKDEVKSFIDDILLLKNQVVPQMEKCVETLDYLSLKQNCHKLKSSMKILGSTILDEMLNKVEILYAENNTSAIKEVMEEIFIVIPNWENELISEFSKIL